MRFVFMHSSILCTVTYYGTIKKLCGISLCDWHLICMICVNLLLYSIYREPLLPLSIHLLAKEEQRIPQLL